jgi:NADPH:quinone reductase-like Zn-dependent oxidoreductase
MPNHFLSGGLRRAEAGFQQYTIRQASVVAPLPAEVPFKSGCVLPLALSTAAMNLYPSYRLGLPLPQPTNVKSANKVIIVWADLQVPVLRQFN